MNKLIATRTRRFGWSILVFLIVAAIAIVLTRQSAGSDASMLTDNQFMTRILGIPAFFFVAALAVTSACASEPIAKATAAVLPVSDEPTKPFIAQVVGLQWLNPLQRQDYPTEWELLWTLGLAKPNKNDDMLKSEPKLFSSLQPIGAIATSSRTETFDGFFQKYIDELITPFHDVYFSNPNYFYNAHNKNKSGWRELAGIHIEYALPDGKLDHQEAKDVVSKKVADLFEIGNVNFPNAWSKSTPPDVRITMGGNNAGFTALEAGLAYLQAHPAETVWVMNWDAPSFPKDGQLDENMVLLVLAGPNYNTDREPLAWIGAPVAKSPSDFEAKKGEPPRVVQAWKAVVEMAAHNAGKMDTDIGYVIHDANNTHSASSDRIGNLAQTLTTEIPEFDFMKQTFNTPALLGEMGAGTALTNVALGIAYANHVGKNVLIAGTSEPEHPTAVMILPPAKIRPINPDLDWFRARGGGSAYLPWWGLRHDAGAQQQGYSR